MQHGVNYATHTHITNGALPVADTHDTAVPGNSAQLCIREGPLTGTGRLHACMRNNHRPGRDIQHLLNRGWRSVSEVDGNAERLHTGNE